MGLRKLLTIKISFVLFLAGILLYPHKVMSQTIEPYLKGVGICHYISSWPGDVSWAYTSSHPEVFWSNLEPDEDRYNIRPLINLINRFSQNPDQQFWVEIYLAGETITGKKKYPQWLIDKGAKYIGRGTDGTFVPWDATFRTELWELLEKINQEFESAWGENLQNMPPGFGGIVVWSGGYYGEMQIYNLSQRPEWERVAKEHFSSVLGLNLEPPTTPPPPDPPTVNPNNEFVKTFNRLWVESAVHLAEIYAKSFNPKIKLMFQLGNGLYGAYGGGFIEYEGKLTWLDEAAAYEILKANWSKDRNGNSRFLFKWNGWEPGRDRYIGIFRNLISRGALGVGYEGGHLNRYIQCVEWDENFNCIREEFNYNALLEMVNIALSTPVDFVCFQPWAIDKIPQTKPQYASLMKTLKDNLGSRGTISLITPTSPPEFPPYPLIPILPLLKIQPFSYFLLAILYLSLLYFFFGTKKAYKTKTLVLIFIFATLIGAIFKSYFLALLLLLIFTFMI